MKIRINESMSVDVETQDEMDLIEFLKIAKNLEKFKSLSPRITFSDLLKPQRTRTHYRTNDEIKQQEALVIELYDKKTGKELIKLLNVSKPTFYKMVTKLKKEGKIKGRSKNERN